MKKTLYMLAVGLLLTTVTVGARPASACDECKASKAGTKLGDMAILGNGTVRSWVTLDEAGKPTALGVTLSETALTGLPAKMQRMGEMEKTLSLPKTVALAPFDHITLDWNPQGHEPSGVYDLPHFDIHFYTVSRDVRSRITATGQNVSTAQKQPDARFIPAGYILPPIPPVPYMGAHWIDPKSPEFNKQPFTYTFLYGTYNGRQAFWEPMITKAFLETNPDLTVPVAQPAAYETAGYYPTRYSVKYDAARKEYTIALEGLTYRGGAGTATRVKTAANHRKAAPRSK